MPRAVFQYKDQYRAHKQRKFFQKLLLIFGVFAVCIVGLVYSIFFANLFDIRLVNIQTPDAQSQTSIQNLTDDFLDTKYLKFIPRRNNALLLSLEQLRAIIRNQLPQMSSIDITRRGLHSLEITASARKPIGIWCNDTTSDCFYFDIDGIAYLKTAPSSGFIFPIIHDQRGNDIHLGTHITDNDFIQKILHAKDDLQASNIAIANFVIPSGSWNEFNAQTIQGFRIYFSANIDIQKQIAALRELKDKKLTATILSQLQYIDLRIQDRIYYK